MSPATDQKKINKDMQAALDKENAEAEANDNGEGEEGTGDPNAALSSNIDNPDHPDEDKVTEKEKSKNGGAEGEYGEEEINNSAKELDEGLS